MGVIQLVGAPLNWVLCLCDVPTSFSGNTYLLSGIVRCFKSSSCPSPGVSFFFKEHCFLLMQIVLETKVRFIAASWTF